MIIVIKIIIIRIVTIIIIFYTPFPLRFLLLLLAYLNGEKEVDSVDENVIGVPRVI